MRKFRFVILCLLLASGCAHLPWGGPKEDPRTRGEQSKDPLGYPQDQVIVTQNAPRTQAGTTQPSDETQTLKPRQEQPVVTPVEQKVYRVQFFATKYPDEASQVAETVAGMVSEKTYIDYKTPYYWVRAGDCQTKEEADRLLQKIKRLGYQESWVVEVESQSEE
jgi:hypothetical protein